MSINILKLLVIGPVLVLADQFGNSTSTSVHISFVIDVQQTSMCKFASALDGPSISSWTCDKNGYPFDGNNGLCRWQTVTCDTDGYVTSIFHYGKQLSGTLSTHIGQITTLSILVFDKNKLQGTLPTEIGMLTRLTELALAVNAFTGNICQSSE